MSETSPEAPTETTNVVIDIPDTVPNSTPQQTARSQEDVATDPPRTDSIHRGNCCMKTRSCFESTKFSFALGAIFFIAGLALIIGISTNPATGDFFLIGPFCVAAGTILFIRGCINKLAKRQAQREQQERDRQANRPLTRAQRSRRNEELALSQDNLIIPPDYYEAVSVPKPTVTAPAHRQLVNTESQTTFNVPTRQDSYMQTSRPTLTRLESVQSQTTFPSMVDMAVDTSDLPRDLDTISQAPPSYFTAVNQTESPAGTSVQYYLPTDDDETDLPSTSGTATTSTGTATGDFSSTATLTHNSTTASIVTASVSNASTSTVLHSSSTVNTSTVTESANTESDTFS